MQIPRLRKHRERRALTQEELAEKAGVSVRSVAGYETGAGARPGSVRKLAAALDMEVEDLLEEEAPKKGRAPLQFEEGRRSSPFLEAWITYIRQRAEAWEENLERLKDSGSKNPFRIEEWSELAYREASSLFSAIGYAMEASGLFDLTDEQQLELERVCIKLVRATERWRELTKSAWAETYHEGRKIIAEQKAARVAQESQKVIALFEERRSA